ncbi:hypothetical protein K435DRAFT_230457 [Dendrothele bispora CBS 962.96]|uniref:Uncharacterized protein n=1 Tax=Dendrothele bispora (strain CBS 962.96) TaxID=1314807 RepID=A0A4S8MM58_DENBC|nr:hypothetical protein K435DRAFT_230457 [Dendrothele bispora CBS 962.96]
MKSTFIVLCFFRILLLAFLGDAVDARVTATNRTIDDAAGDLVTGIKPIFSPATKRVWRNSRTCIEERMAEECVSWVDKASASDGTWTAGKHEFERDSEDLSITLRFHGTAIYVYFILPGSTILPFVTESYFILDSSPVGHFFYEPTHEFEYLSQRSVSVFSKTGLTNEAHTLVISTAGIDRDVFINFDYAVYTVETREPVDDSETTFTTSRNPLLFSTKFKRQTTTMNASGEVKTGKSIPMGAIIGAVVAIVACLGIIGAIVMYKLRRRDVGRFRIHPFSRKAELPDQESKWFDDFNDETPRPVLPRWSPPGSTEPGYHDHSQHQSENDKVYFVSHPTTSPFRVDFDDEMTKNSSQSLPLLSNNPISMPDPVITSSISPTIPGRSSILPGDGRNSLVNFTPNRNRRQSRQLLPALPPVIEGVAQNAEIEVGDWTGESLKRLATTQSVSRHTLNGSWGSDATLVDENGLNEFDDDDEHLDKMDLLSRRTATAEKDLPSSSVERKEKGKHQFGHWYPPVRIPISLLLADSAMWGESFVSEDPFARERYQPRSEKSRKRKQKRHTFHTFDGTVSVQMLMSSTLTPTKPVPPRDKSTASLKSSNGTLKLKHPLGPRGPDDVRHVQRETWGTRLLSTDKAVKKSPLEQELRIQRKILRDDSEPRSSDGPYQSKSQRRTEQRLMSAKASIHGQVFINDHVRDVRRPTISEQGRSISRRKQVGHALAQTCSKLKFDQGTLQSVTPSSRNTKRGVLFDDITLRLSLSNNAKQPHLHRQSINISSALQLIGWTLELVFRHHRFAYSSYLKGTFDIVNRVQNSEARVVLYVMKFLMKYLSDRVREQQEIIAAKIREETWYNRAIRSITGFNEAVTLSSPLFSLTIPITS